MNERVTGGENREIDVALNKRLGGKRERVDENSLSGVLNLSKLPPHRQRYYGVGVLKDEGVRVRRIYFNCAKRELGFISKSSDSDKSTK